MASSWPQSATHSQTDDDSDPVFCCSNGNNTPPTSERERDLRVCPSGDRQHLRTHKRPRPQGVVEQLHLPSGPGKGAGVCDSVTHQNIQHGKPCTMAMAVFSPQAHRYANNPENLNTVLSILHSCKLRVSKQVSQGVSWQAGKLASL